VKTSSIKLGFIGSYKIDLLIYLGMIFHHMGLKVLIMDISPKRYLNYYISGISIDGITHLGGIDYCLNEMPEFLLVGYDIVLCDYGLSLKELNGYIECDWHFLITDAQRHHIDPLRYQCRLIKERTNDDIKLVKIYRDLVPSKIDEDYLDYILEVPMCFDVVASYTFSYSLDDYKLNLLNSYNEQVQFVGLSKQYLDFFQDVVEEICKDSPNKTHVANSRNNGKKTNKSGQMMIRKLKNDTDQMTNIIQMNKRISKAISMAKKGGSIT
jgi:hypothetical protein